eukprot:7365553-Karenia_brevis.AAC.1
MRRAAIRDNRVREAVHSLNAMSTCLVGEPSSSIPLDHSPLTQSERSVLSRIGRRIVSLGHEPAGRGDREAFF